MLMKKICRHAKNQESRRHWQLGAVENRASGLTARCCGVCLTLTWFEDTFFDVSGLPELLDISMNMTECHCGFLHL